MLTASLHTQPSNSVPESLNALDWLNFFLAALLTGFGPFVAVYLADLGWASADVGFVLTVAGLAGLLAQVPAGELIDIAASKRAIVATGITAVALGLLILGLRRDISFIFFAAVIQGATKSAARWSFRR
jgi:MFS family permease